jgi:hypothetical protein
MTLLSTPALQELLVNFPRRRQVFITAIERAV